MWTAGSVVPGSFQSTQPARAGPVRRESPERLVQFSVFAGVEKRIDTANRPAEVPTPFGRRAVPLLTPDAGVPAGEIHDENDRSAKRIALGPGHAVCYRVAGVVPSLPV